MKLDECWQRYFGGKYPGLVNRYNVMVSLVKSPTVLDIGCGQGLLGYLLCAKRKDCTKIVGIDTLEAILADGRKRFKSSIVTLQLGRAEELVFEDESFSTAVLCEILEHLKDPVAAVREALRVLESGGRVITSVPADEARKSKAHCQVFSSVEQLQDLYEGKVKWRGGQRLARWHFAWGDKK